MDRPEEDKLSECRGTDILRLGTGFIYHVERAKGTGDSQHCPCDKCDGNVERKFWVFKVWTAHHVVYNTEEAKKTKVDLFYDTESCRQAGKMKTVVGLEVLGTYPKKDACFVLCATHDEAIGEKIESTYRRLFGNTVNAPDLSDLGLPFWVKGLYPAMIVSHPHGQPKMVTVGDVRDEESHMKYNTPTCPGSSGASVFMLNPSINTLHYLLWAAPVHGGSYDITSKEYKKQFSLFQRFLQTLRLRNATLYQLNYGSYW